MTPKPPPPNKQVKRQAAARPTLARLVIESSTLLELANSRKARAEFPFLSALAAAHAKISHCPPCQRGAAGTAYNEALAACKRAIAGLASDRANRLKAILGADQATVVYREAKGRIKERHF